MEALKIEIINPKALKLIQGMEDLNLIKISNEPETRLQEYLKEMRKHSDSAPSLEDLAKLVDEVRSPKNEK